MPQRGRGAGARNADGGPALIIGTPWVEAGKVYNAACLLAGGRIPAVRFKVDLPNTGVFDEKRVFAPGPLPGPVEFRGVRIGVPICEDIWAPDVCECLAETGSEILVVPNGSPYHHGKHDLRLNQCGRARHRNRIATDLCEPGRRPGRARVRRRVVRAQCRPVGRVPASVFRRGRYGYAMEAGGGTLALHRRPQGESRRGRSSRLRRLRARPSRLCGQERLPGVVLGLSGGIDSALCAAMAVDALGAKRVHCVMLPYRYTSNASLADAAAIAEKLGVHYDIVPIAAAVEGSRRASRICSRASRATPPKRICNRVPAAPS